MRKEEVFPSLPLSPFLSLPVRAHTHDDHATNTHTRIDYNNYNRRIPPSQLARQLAAQVHLFTLYGGARPLGVGLVVIGYDEVEKTYECYGIEASGT